MAAPWDKDTLTQALKQDPAFCQKCPTLAADIISRRLEFVKLVEFLKEFLTDSDPAQRAVGVLVLASVLKELPPDFLREDEINFIVAFFCDRLKDHHDVIPATLNGIFAMLKMKNLPNESPALILNTLMLNINCQSQRQEDRLSIYRILDLLIIPHLQNLQNLGPDLVYHVISAIDGERDPRNLKFLFSMLPNILRGLTLGHLTEDCFEVVACYFPVDFKPAANDQNQLTREDLALALADCLTAVPVFTEFCIPLLLEKLDSPLRLAKLDSLYLLRKGCSAFPAEEVAVHLSPLWMSLSREVLSGADLEVRTEAQRAITQLLRCLSDMPADANNKKSDPMRQLLNDIISASTSAFSEVNTSLFIPATELLLAAAGSGSFACEHILQKVIPLVVEYFETKPESAGRSVYLSIISRFLALCKAHGVIPQELPDISTQWSQLVQVYFTAIEHEAGLVRREALTGLCTMASTLNSFERPKLYDLLGALIDKEEVSDVREQCKLCLREVGSQYVSEVSDYILAKKLVIDGIAGDDSRFERRLEAQCCLAALPPFSEKVLPKAVELILTSKDSHHFQAILTSLRKLLLNLESGANHVYESMHKNSVVPLLLNWWISSTQDDECVWVNNEIILDEVCLIISNVSRNLKKEEQEPLLEQILPKFYPGSDSFRPYAISSPRHHIFTVPLFEAILGSLHSDVKIANVEKLCLVLTELAINCPYSSIAVSASRLCASLLNKMTEDKILEDILVNVSVTLEAAQTQPEEKSAVQATAMCGWIIKGLAMRGYKHLEKWIDKLVDTLGDNRQSIALSAAHAFRVIMEDDLRFLNTESHCKFRLLYKQRVFVSSLKLVKTSRQAPVCGRTAYVVALTYLLSGVPQTVLTNYLGEVLPLLLESLSQDSLTLLEAALNTVNSLLGQSVFSESLKDHVQTMIPRLLPLTTYQTSMKVRRSALNCLTEICSLPPQLLLPFKDEVVSQLEVCLDDHKRLVRKDAVKARSHWIMLAAPGSKQ